MEHYTISNEYQNTGIIKIRIPKIYTTISFNTTTPSLYSQDKLKKFYKYNELKKYITLSINKVDTTADNSSIILEELATVENLVIIEPTAIEPEKQEPEKQEEVDINDLVITALSLKELRLIYPEIVANSKQKFLEKIYDKQK